MFEVTGRAYAYFRAHKRHRRYLVSESEGMGDSPAAPIVFPTMGRRHQHLAQCCAFGLTNSFLGYKFPKLMSSHPVPLYILSYLLFRYCFESQHKSNLTFKIVSEHDPGNRVSSSNFNPFKPEFTIFIFIHYKPRIAVAILDLQWLKMIR